MLTALLVGAFVLRAAAGSDVAAFDAAGAGASQAEAPRSSSIVIPPAGEPGVALLVEGQIKRADGSPASGLEVYVYQTDARGLYTPQGNDNRNPRLKGRLRTDDQGRYRVQTIRPGQYPESGPPAHIHYEVTTAAGVQRFELVFEGDSRMTDAIRRQAAAHGEYALCTPLKEANGSQQCRGADLYLK